MHGLKSEVLEKEKIISEAILIEEKDKMSSTKKLVLYALAIFVCYFYVGILQESITRTKYGDGDIFTYTLTLVFLLCFVSVIFAKFMLMTFMKQGKDTTSTKYYASCAVSYLGAMVASNMALVHINYPTQVVGKSCKPIPMMILGFLIGKKRYSLRKYLFVTMIVVGIVLFMLKDKKAADNKSDSSYIGKGNLLLLISLTLDGFTGGIQERMKSEHKTKSGHMMYNINLWSILILGPALFITGELWSFAEFVQKYPYVISNLTAFSLLSALGQMFIFLMVSEFGPLPCSIVTTTRKFFTVLGSVIIFGNSLTSRQWIGTFIVFSGLILDSIYGKGDPSKKK